MLRGGLLAAVLLLTAGFGGCIGTGDGVDPASTADGVPDDHPFPDGDEGWPADLTGPFELGRTLTDPIESFDGTPLEATIYLPDLPDGVKAPVVLWSQPYTGGCAFNALLGGVPCMPASDSEFIYEGGYRVDPSLLVEHGYAVAIVNVRGTGNSGGCFDFGGETEQRDQVHLVDHLAEQDWSNGHVAMYGHSYHGWTSWQAAIHQPTALKTIVASGVVTDPYTFSYSPQGAPSWISGGFNAGFTASLNFVPPLGGGPEHATAEHLPHYPERLCPEVASVVAETAKGQVTDLRDGPFWDERRLITRLPNVTSSVLVSHGFNDDSGHAFQEDDIWHSLPAETPKRIILGQWGHDLPPPPGYLEDAPFGSDWHEDTLVPWLDHWLKGIGDPADLHVGTVHYQDDDEAWHETPAWPPSDASHEVLYLSPSAALSPSPEDGSARFSTAPDLSGAPHLCMDTLPDGVPNTALTYLSEPVDTPIRLAGNPLAYLDLESTLPGGLVTVDLFAVASDGGCQDEPAGFTHMASGAADLRFHQGNYVGEDFPVDQPTPVRVDLYNEAWTLEPGERLAVVVSGEGWDINQAQPYYPVITLHGGTDGEASHVVLPVAEGTLGGQAPTLAYPPQPFLPADPAS